MYSNIIDSLRVDINTLNEKVDKLINAVAFISEQLTNINSTTSKGITPKTPKIDLLKKPSCNQSPTNNDRPSISRVTRNTLKRANAALSPIVQTRTKKIIKETPISVSLPFPKTPIPSSSSITPTPQSILSSTSTSSITPTTSEQTSSNTQSSPQPSSCATTSSSSSVSSMSSSTCVTTTISTSSTSSSTISTTSTITPVSNALIQIFPFSSVTPSTSSSLSTLCTTSSSSILPLSSVDIYKYSHSLSSITPINETVQSSGTAQSESSLDVPLKAADRFKCIFLSNFDPHTSCDNICTHIKSRFPNSKLKIEQLPTKNPDYASFKLYVTNDIFNELLDHTFWPDKIIVHEFVNKRNNTRNPFRKNLTRQVNRRQ
ncbi:uncharacterized protein LOC129913437 [Episyrphus balteatus]|uniref:uncharacterized protein LOC129913437 n=1 Tax=Episyrphus balteatus TaxID=286459 RepID=UPI0024855310|nr:uncharacterized protein LOC129913437 [Episyrphus balteatus]